MTEPTNQPERDPANAELERSRRDPPTDQEVDLSLELLGRFYAAAVSGNRTGDLQIQDQAAAGDSVQQTQPTDQDDAAEPGAVVSPLTILEAMLFVGLEGDKSLSARKAASLIRGVSPTEVDQLIEQLNEIYRADHSAYLIDKSATGYRLRLCPEMEPVRTRMLGKIREARLSHAAIEVLAIVAYHQPVSVEEIDKLRLRHSGAILSQLVQRELLSVHRIENNKRVRVFQTTDKFLALFGLETIDDLPQAHLDNELEFLDH